ncbi:galactosylgalactosylxylosylprotein 3-beta-glucuronosyltransferase I [Phlebotomus argentipes]|uniref:galactosylgalactosylxylosylprotein 3-beta-glucuronosyltransferase I n=1 Tax=Phlebotomus argentipes TaxID=94469 RepID=UPI00289380E5|nr:galactosylgalactosylxylosylprotein 3-beta-glucuronosyltransferase I [Phlebotomus argentipes]
MLDFRRKYVYSLLAIVAVFFLLYSFLKSTLKCDRESSPIASSSELLSGSNVVFAITPTYYRPVQKAELTRIAQTLMLVPFVHWILVEDASETSTLVRNILTRTGLSARSTQLHAKTPSNFKLGRNDPNWSKPRGVEQRNTALAWIRQHFQSHPRQAGVVFFMDDDNIYSIELFREMQRIEKGRVGVWPVGLVGGLMVEKPLLDATQERVVGFNSLWRPERQFPIDMAGFAISLDLILDNPGANFSYDVERGYQETAILRHVTSVDRLQPLANKCRDVLVWHTRTEATKLDGEKNLKKSGAKPSDLGMEV